MKLEIDLFELILHEIGCFFIGLGIGYLIWG